MHLLANALSTLASTDSASGVLFVDLLVILSTAAVVATLFRRFRLEAIPGYLVAGALVGPHALGLVRGAENIDQISGLAIILLMFGIGLTLETAAVRRGTLSILSVGVISTLAFVVLTWPVAVLFGPPAPAALVIAMALSMSSTAVLLRILQQRRELGQTHGRICVGVSIAQDMLSVLFLAMLPPIAAWAGASSPGADESNLTPLHLLSSGALGFGGIVAMLAVGRILLPRLMQFVARTDAKSGLPSGELVLVLAAAVAIGAAILTGFLGFSPEMGAFLAGFMLSLTPFRHQLAGQLAPLRDLLMAVFFTAVGLRVDPAVLAADWPLILLGLVALLTAKAALIGFTAWSMGATASVGVLSGLYLAQAGEFSLVILGAGEKAGVFSHGKVGNAVAIVVLSLVVAPLLVGPAHTLAARAAGLPLARWIRRSAMRDGPTAEAPSSTSPAPRCGPVIIAGFGPVGRNLADRFQRMGVPFSVIELNPATVEKQTTLGRTIIYGDATNPEVLESAGVRNAEAVILTIPHEEAVIHACQLIRRIAPKVFIAARANYLSQGIKARLAGADHVVVEEMLTAEAMARDVLDHLGRRRSLAPPDGTPDAPAPDPSTPT